MSQSVQRPCYQYQLNLRKYMGQILRQHSHLFNYIDSWINIQKFSHTYSRIPYLHSLIPSTWYDNFRVLKIVFHTVHTVRMSWVTMITSVHRGKKRFCCLIIHINLSLLPRYCELCTARVIIKAVQMMLWINFYNMKTLPRCYMPMLDSCVSTRSY